MSESEQKRDDSPLLSERGATTISDTVVTSIAGMAAQEVEGVHMGGGGSRTAGGVLGSITGSETNTSGISVEVGRTEAAIDLKMGIEYDKNILQTVEEVRRRITDRVQEMTGLRIKELNATITDITFPEKEKRRRIGSRGATSTSDDSPETEVDTTAVDSTATEAAPEARTTPESEPDADESETTQVETTDAETAQVETTGEADTEVESTSEEEVQAEDRPIEEGETTEVRADEANAEELPSDETSETTEVRSETQTPEEDEAEARMRRRAEERARRRRRRTDDS